MYCLVLLVDIVQEPVLPVDTPGPAAREFVPELFDVTGTCDGMFFKLTGKGHNLFKNFVVACGCVPFNVL